MFYDVRLLTRKGILTLAWYVDPFSTRLLCPPPDSMFLTMLYLSPTLITLCYRLAGTVDNPALLKGYMDRMIRAHGRANVLATWYVKALYLIMTPTYLVPIRACSSFTRGTYLADSIHSRNSASLCPLSFLTSLLRSAHVLQPSTPMSLRLRAVLLLGIVRLFCDQVKETEKEAESCMRRVLARNAQFKPVSAAIAPELVDKEEDSAELRELWKQSRQLLERIDYSSGSAPTLPMRYTSSIPPEKVSSTIWRDASEMSASEMDIEEMRGEGNDESTFISLPRPAPTTAWTNHGNDDLEDPGEVEVTRGRHSLMMKPPMPENTSFDFDDSVDPPTPSRNFLDILLEKHDAGELGGSMEDIGSLIQENDEIQTKIADLLDPSAAYDSDNEYPTFNDLYSPPTPDPVQDGWAGIQLNEESFEPHIDLPSFSESVNTSATSQTKQKKPRTYPIDDESTTIPHEEMRANIERYDAQTPRADLATLEDPRSLVRRIKFRNLERLEHASLARVMGLSEGKSIQISGALAYLQLAHQTFMARRPLTTTASLQELSYLPENEPSGGEVSESLFPPFDKTFLSPLDTVSNFVETDGGEFGADVGAECGGDIGPSESLHLDEGQIDFGAFGADVEDYNDVEHYPIQMDYDEAPPDPLAPSSAELEESSAKKPNVDMHPLSSDYIEIAPELTIAEENQTLSTIGTVPEAKGASRAFLNYIAVKAVPPLLSSSSTDDSQASTHTSNFTDEMTLVSSHIDGKAYYTTSKLFAGCKRRTAARAFLLLLELASISSIALEQDEPYEDVTIIVPMGPRPEV